MRQGQPANLMAIALAQPLGLPAQNFNSATQPDKLKIQLGRKLFFDRRLSRNKTMSCAMCHIPEQGFTNNELARPIGFEGRGLKRNAPTILNVAYYTKLFADARENTLEQQVWSPLLAGNEMNNASIGVVIDFIQNNPEYQPLFELAFSEPPNMLNIGQALAQYQRSLIAANSKFDQWHFGGQNSLFTEGEKRGFELFTGKAACAVCHRIDQQYALFTDNRMHNTGVGYSDSMLTPSKTIAVQLAPGVIAQLDRETVNSVGEAKPNDLGRYEISLDPADRWKYRTSSLRNIALTAPYMHDGKFNALSDVIDFYNRGGEPHKLLSPLVRPLGLNQQDKKDLLSFLLTLTGSNVRTLVADGLAAPIGDTNSVE